MDEKSVDTLVVANDTIRTANDFSNANFPDDNDSRPKFYDLDKLIETKKAQNKQKLNHSEEITPVIDDNPSLESVETQQNETITEDSVQTVDVQAKKKEILDQHTEDVTLDETEKVAQTSAKPKPAPNPRRMKFFAILLGVCIAMLSGLTIYNQVAINNTANSINAVKTEYNASVYKYIKKITKLDKLQDYTDSDNIVDNTSFIPIKLSNKEKIALAGSDVKIKTNWFDIFMSKIKNLLGKN